MIQNCCNNFTTKLILGMILLVGFMLVPNNVFAAPPPPPPPITVVISTTATDPTGISPIPFTAIFSEEVQDLANSFDFTLSDIEVKKGDASNLLTSDHITWTFDVTPEIKECEDEDCDPCKDVKVEVEVKKDKVKAKLTPFAKNDKSNKEKIKFLPCEETPIIEILISGGHNCNNCQSPSIGVTDKGKRVVDEGITVNGNTMDVDYYFTPFPLIQADIGEPVTMLFVIWDDRDDNIAHVEVGLGKGKIGESFAKFEDTMIWKRNVMSKVETITYDHTAFEDVTMKILGKAPCTSESTIQRCDIFQVQFTPIKAIVGDVVFGISIWDDGRNVSTTFFNEGLQIGTILDLPQIAEPIIPEIDLSCKASSKGYDRNCPEFHWQMIGQQLIAQELMKQFGY